MPPVLSRLSKMGTIAPYQVHMGNESSLEAKGRGAVILFIIIGSATKQCSLKNVLFVLSLQYFLSSVTMLAERGIISTFTEKRAKFPVIQVLLQLDRKADASRAKYGTRKHL